MHAKNVCDPQQRRNAGVDSAGLDVLVGGAADTGGKEDGFLGAVLAESCDADAVSDGAAFGEQPVVVGQGWHLLYAEPTMIISQPGKPGLL